VVGWYDSKPVSARDSANAFLRRILPSVAALVAGAAVGWLFQQDFLRVLIDPWVDRNVIHESYPSPERVSLWSRLVPATVGVVVSLPWLTLMGWRLLSARSTFTHRRSGYAFVLSSYVAIGVGLGLAVFVLLPTIALRQLEAAHYFRPIPWAFVELELCWGLGIALAFQLAVALIAFARIRLVEQRDADDGPRLRRGRG
jgi:Sec-independent protein secretion pathway component TatC